MNDDQHTDLDAVGTTGGKATTEVTQRHRTFVGSSLTDLFSRIERPREDTLLGEIIRICVRLDKAGFAKVYAAVKTEEAAMDARLDERWQAFRNEQKSPL